MQRHVREFFSDGIDETLIQFDRSREPSTVSEKKNSKNDMRFVLRLNGIEKSNPVTGRCPAFCGGEYMDLAEGQRIINRITIQLSFNDVRESIVTVFYAGADGEGITKEKNP